MSERDLRAEALALCHYLDDQGLEAGEGLAVMVMAMGTTAKAMSGDETQTRMMLASLHERMLQAAGIDDSSGSQH